MEELNVPQKISTPDKAESFRKKTLGEVNTVLSHHYNDEDFVGQVNHIVERTLRTCTRNLSASKASQEETFGNVCKFLNCLFKDVTIKKFYNNAPNIQLENYKNEALGQKFLHNLYGKEWKLFYKRIIVGGSCHHRVLILNDIFDALQKKGLILKKKIFLYNNDGGHSFLLIEFDGKKYLADVFGEHINFDTIISPLEVIARTSDDPYLGQISLDKNDKNNRKFSVFDTPQEFVAEIDQRKHHNIKLSFKPNLNGNFSQEMKIVINDESFLFTLGNTTHTLFFPKDFFLPKNIQECQVVDFLVKNAEGMKNAKQEISKYLDMFRYKISLDRLHEIFPIKSGKKKKPR